MISRGAGHGEAVHSEAGHSEVGHSEDPGAQPTPVVERYQIIGLLGIGGMGRVHLAVDRTLGREIALKDARPDRGAGAQERLMVEAARTAVLDHPGIVTVLDAGRGADGRPFYTMRLLRGRPLSRVVEERPTLAGRLPLVRSLLGVAEAVGFAHQQGIVHRDLKPSNIVMGALGEVQVVDWGLSARTGTAAGGSTPGYAAPEQTEGSPADPRQDVWALGAILRWLLLETPGPRPMEGRLDPHAPQELVSITQKALSPDPVERYPTAVALAADLANWLDGNAVLAHRYSIRELARRVWSSRRPLILAVLSVLVAALAASLAITIGTERERRRAVEAEHTATTSLGEALRLQALAAFADGAWPEAQVLALSSLSLAPSPDAWGVLAGVGPPVRARRLQFAPAPRCVGPSLVADGQLVLCPHQGRIDLWDPVRDAVRWSVAGRSRAEGRAGGATWWTEGPAGEVELRRVSDGTLRWTGAAGSHVLDTVGDHALVLDDSSRSLLLVDTEAGQALGALPWCGTRMTVPNGSLNQSATRAAWSCGDAVAVGSFADGSVRTTPTGHMAWPFVVAFRGEEDLLVIGTHGELMTVVGREVSRMGRTSAGPNPRISVTADGNQAAVAGGEGGVEWWDLRAGAIQLRLPRRASREVNLGSGSLGSGLVELGPAWAQWAVVPGGLPPVVHHPEGLGSLAVRPDEVAVGDGRGAIWRWSRRSGAPATEQVGPLPTLPQLAWLGGRLLVTSGGGSAVRFFGEGADPLLQTSANLRRIRGVEGDQLLAMASRRVLYRRGADGVVRELPTGLGEQIELGVSPRGRFVVVVGDRGEVQVWSADGNKVSVSQIPFAATATVDDMGTAVYSAGPGFVRCTGPTPWSWAAEGVDPLDADLSPDGRWLAVAATDGNIYLLDARRGTLRARLRGHTERVAAVAFADDRLYSASWDGDLRTWSLDGLDRNVEEQAAEAEVAWALRVEDILQTSIAGRGEGPTP